jgi:uncharacterized membrane protein YphA (DoxX/SURF4 family)
MNVEIFHRIYDIIVSILLICGGYYFLVFRQQIDQSNIERLKKLYDKTHLSLFRRMAEQTALSPNNILVIFIGSGFIIFGILLLFGYVHTGNQ